ncbi:ABC transporter substrate-binding protein [Vibrio genomosp. F10]|uniref:ABC transporter substrate-binding protein n=1 Tax=Vibrio genomosp. F10 TaxID=723171 RepID=UPI0002E1BDCB|nr:ABC transporter substrate-binding protein [Vibrio genomosp. F10]OEE95787.1 peptide ABC transporter substrate-binding protein [Vibrio genomosp. F10 str. 9ZD137]
MIENPPLTMNNKDIFVKKLIALIVFICAASVQAMEIKHELGKETFEKTPVKIVALDWALTETVLSLGLTPQGVADVGGYQTWVSQPELSGSVINVGSRREPNLELLTELKPDVILISTHMAPAYRQLSKIAPTLVYSIYSDRKTPLESAKHITSQLGVLFDRQAQAQIVITQTEKRLEENGQKIKANQSDQTSLLFVRFINDKTVRVHSQGSLAQSTIEGMGLSNAWQEQTNLWGFTTAGIEKLAEHQESHVLIFGPLKEDERQRLGQSPLWQAMKFTRTDSVHELPAIWTFGGLIAAQRFSDSITKELMSAQ